MAEEVVKCPKCKEDIAKGAVKCKHCGADLRNWFVQHKVISVILGIILLGAVISATGGGKTTTTTTGKSSTESKIAAAKSDYIVGEAASIDKQILRVTKATRNYSTGNEYMVPESGKEYVLVEVSIENNGTDQVSFNTFDFQVQDSSGVLKTETFVDAENKLNSGNLAPGGKVTGTMVFEVPAGDTGLKLVFKPSFWSNKTIYVKL